MIAHSISVLSFAADDACRQHAIAALAAETAEGWLLGDADAANAAERLQREPWSCALVDVRLADAHGTAWLAALAAASPGTAVIVVAPAYDDDAASQALTCGAQDFLDWHDAARLARAIEHAVARQARVEHVRRARRDTALSRRCPVTGALDGEALESLPLDEVLEPVHCRQPLAALLVACGEVVHARDTWGAAAADELLREVARRVRMSSRPGDAIARVRGDALLLLLPATAHDAAAALTERIRDALQSHPLTTAGRSVPLTGGVAIADLSPRARFGEACAIAFDALAASRATPADDDAAVTLDASTAPRRAWPLHALRGGSVRATRGLR